VKCKLKEILGERGMSQSFLARQMGVHRQVMYSWVSNKVIPAVDVAFRVANFLNVQATDIWVFENEEEEN
jgi:putative transcriptional regulator